MKKLLAFMLAMLMILPVLVACGGDGGSGTETTLPGDTPGTTELPDNTTTDNPGDTSTPDVTDPPATTEPKEPEKLPESSVQLIKDKNAAFRIVYEYNNLDAKGLAEDLYIELLKAKVKGVGSIYDDSKAAPTITPSRYLSETPTAPRPQKSRSLSDMTITVSFLTETSSLSALTIRRQ